MILIFLHQICRGLIWTTKWFVENKMLKIKVLIAFAFAVSRVNRGEGASYPMPEAYLTI